MTDADRRAEKYLDECATSCPHCGAGAESRTRRFSLPTVRREPDARPTVVVPNACEACGGRWSETYRLESADVREPRAKP